MNTYRCHQLMQSLQVRASALEEGSLSPDAEITLLAAQQALSPETLGQVAAMLNVALQKFGIRSKP